MYNINDDPDGQEVSYSLLRDTAQMDRSVVERLRATIDVSLEWAEQTLDLISRLDSELQTLATRFDPEYEPDADPASDASGPPSCASPLDSAVERARVAQSVQSLRNGMRDLLMSMQHQDLIGQAIERAAGAMEQRSEVVGRLLKQRGDPSSPPTEIARIDGTYRTEDNHHRTVDWVEVEQQGSVTMRPAA